MDSARWLASAAIAQAFAAIRREDFLGPGPWLVLRWLRNYVPTPDADPVYLYTDDLVALIVRHLQPLSVHDRDALLTFGKTHELGIYLQPGGIDSVGSTTLANLLSMTKYGGAIAACGLAAGMDLPSSVAPFILRGVCLLGIESVMCPIELRKTAWRRLARDLDPGKLTEITHEIGLDHVIAAAGQILAGQVRGRIVVKII